jgi:hypothetical protein
MATSKLPAALGSADPSIPLFELIQTFMRTFAALIEQDEDIAQRYYPAICSPAEYGTILSQWLKKPFAQASGNKLDKFTIRVEWRHNLSGQREYIFTLSAACCVGNPISQYIHTPQQEIVKSIGKLIPGTIKTPMAQNFRSPDVRPYVDITPVFPVRPPIGDIPLQDIPAALYKLQANDAEACLGLMDNIKDYFSAVPNDQQIAAGKALTTLFCPSLNTGITARQMMNPDWREGLRTTVQEVQSKADAIIAAAKR